MLSKAGFQEQDIIRYTPLTIGQRLQQGALSAVGFELWYDEWPNVYANRADLRLQL